CSSLAKSFEDGRSQSDKAYGPNSSLSTGADDTFDRRVGSTSSIPKELYYFGEPRWLKGQLLRLEHFWWVRQEPRIREHALRHPQHKGLRVFEYPDRAPGNPNSQ